MIWYPKVRLPNKKKSHPFIIFFGLCSDRDKNESKKKSPDYSVVSNTSWVTVPEKIRIKNNVWSLNHWKEGQGVGFNGHETCGISHVSVSRCRQEVADVPALFVSQHCLNSARDIPKKIVKKRLELLEKVVFLESKVKNQLKRKSWFKQISHLTIKP